MSDTKPVPRGLRLDARTYCAEPLAGEPCCPKCGNASPQVDVHRGQLTRVIHYCEID
jgi:hypothetical protein